jgi:hypothetical protein
MQFLDDVSKLYNYITEKKDDLNKLYSYLEQKDYDKLHIIDSFASEVKIDNIDDQKRLAILNRIINLKEDGITQILSDKSSDEIEEYKGRAYQFAKSFWLDFHKDTIYYIEQNQLLTPFYREVIKGVDMVGVAMSEWQPKWTKHIINTINKELKESFDGDDTKVIDYLNSNNLLDMGHGGVVADRCYSALVIDGEDVVSKAYIDAFKEDTNKVIDALEIFMENLMGYDDNIYEQKWQYIEYIQSLVAAFSEKDTSKLVSKWADVDRAWMKITTPIQIGHPLEYYEDHYRKAVALEWDIRLVNPNFDTNHTRVDKIKEMFAKVYKTIDNSFKEYKDIYEFSLKSLDKVQLYLSKPAFFYGAEFNGLFSAQVVPNDEVVSKESGKKIFAFSDDILQISRAKPFLKLSKEVLGQEFLSKDREFLFGDDKKWHQLYDITTIGHEYGHILWCDDETESVMNSDGNFKNIEEFKATTGGLVSFFLDDGESELNMELLRDVVKRAIGLIAWMEVDEVLPYYCEGLIHLSGLFETRVLNWSDNKLTIDISDNSFEAIKSWYIDTYSSLAIHYLDKQPSLEFLNRYATKSDGKYLPNDDNIKDFVNYYYRLYKKIGQEIDNSDSKENYI